MHLKQVGSHPLKVRASSSEASDEIHKYILVKVTFNFIELLGE